MRFFSNGIPSIWKGIPTIYIRAVKLTGILILIACLQVSAKTSAQRLSISLKNGSLKELFGEIEKKTNYTFFYDVGILKDAKPVTVEVKDASVEEILAGSLKEQALDFSIENRTIFIKKENKAAIGQSNGSEPPTIIRAKGIVYSESGQPLSGANITIKETGHGTVTNAKGEFQLSAVPVNSTLVVTFIGYTSQSVKIKDATEMKIYLIVAKNELDKAVVQAYGLTTQRLATGNIATVTAAQIEKQPVMNPLEALVGRVPGLVITENNGYASAPINVEIRGRANIGAFGSDPLIIVDGVPLSLNGTGSGNAVGLLPVMPDGSAVLGPATGQSPLFSINPSDIESVTVLKDADATAIYGSRGANGVLIITTKKGKIGKTKWDVNVYEGIQKITGHYSLLNTQQYLAMRREAFKNDGILPDQGSAYELLVWDTTRYTDFQKYFWSGLGRETDVETGISGGDRQTTFRISGGYHRQLSIFSYSGADQRGSVQFNLTHKSLDQKLSLSFSNLYSYAQSDLIGLSGTVTTAPDTPPIFTSSHMLNYAGWVPISDQFPYASLQQPYQSKTGFLNSNMDIKYEVFKGLTASSQIGYGTTHLTNNQNQPIISLDPTTNPKGSAQFGNTNYSTVIFEPQLQYSNTLGKGKLSSLLGGSFQSTSFNGNVISGLGYVNDNLIHSVANAPIKQASDGFSEYKYDAIFARLNYNWDNKYILNLSARRDGSSRFGPGRQFGNFGAIGAAWIFTEEGWLKDKLSFLSFGKLRGSYGLTGSDAISDYQYLTQWSGSRVLPYNGVPAYVPIQHANPLLQWQTNRKLEGAINLGFLKDRITIETDWYRNRIGNQLLSFVLPIITGFNSVVANFPATVQNTGWEGTLNAKIIDKKNLTWTFELEFGANRNILLAYPNIQQSPYFGRFVVGQPLNITRVLHYTGVDPLTGQYTFLDKNKDGQIDPYSTDQNNDLFVKDLSIKLDGGFGSDLIYKGWQLSLFFNCRIQTLPSSIYNGVPGTANNNQSVDVLNRWQKPGDKAKFARYTTNPTQSDDNFYFNSDGIYSNGSYIRLKNASLSYQFSDKWMKAAGFQNCLIYLRGQNLFVLTKYDGLDPDVPGLSFPNPRVYTLGLKFTL